MKSTYPGQSNALVVYYKRVIVILILMLFSAYFLSATAPEVNLSTSISQNNTDNQKHFSSAMFLNSKMADGTICNHDFSFEPNFF